MKTTMDTLLQSMDLLHMYMLVEGGFRRPASHRPLRVSSGTQEEAIIRAKRNYGVPSSVNDCTVLLLGKRYDEL